MSSPALRLLVDVGVGGLAEEMLKAEGHDITTVRSIDPRMTDDDIVRLAAKEGRMVVTMDRDFGELVYHSGLRHAGVLLLRMEDADGQEKAEALLQILREHGWRMADCFCVYQKGRLRIRSPR